MLRTITSKFSLLLLAGLIIIGIVNTTSFTEPAYGIIEESTAVAAMPVTRVSHTKTPGIVTIGNDAVTIDMSNTDDGYLAVKYTGENQKVKFIISKAGDEIIYDIPQEKYKEYVALPLHAGSGEYTISVWESMGGTIFKSVLEKTETISMVDDKSPFLYPSLYVDFNENSLAVLQAAIIALDAENDRELANEVFNWITETIEYNYQLEEEIRAGRRYMTDLDDVMISKKGICLDYATLMVAMLRSQGVPAKVVVGMVEYQGEILYPKHSWANVYFANVTGGEWIHYDPTFKITKEEGVESNSHECIYSPEYCY